MDWMTTKQKEDFEIICLMIDSINSPEEFYEVINEINKNYDPDVINCARQYKKCFNAFQYRK